MGGPERLRLGVLAVFAPVVRKGEIPPEDVLLLERLISDLLVSAGHPVI